MVVVIERIMMTCEKYFGSTIGKTGDSMDLCVTKKEESRIIPRI